MKTHSNFLQVILLVLNSFGVCMLAMAQAPQAIPYQAVARDSSGNLLSNHTISIRFSIHQVTATGSIEFQETHDVNTNNLGLFTVNIGTGTASVGSLSSVNWGNSAKYLQVEIDTNGGTTFLPMGTSQLLSVPYALYSERSRFFSPGNNIGNTFHWNGSSWIADNSIFNNGTRAGVGTDSPIARLHVRSGDFALLSEATDSNGVTNAVQATIRSATNNSAAIRADANRATGNTSGVMATNASGTNSASGVKGISTSISGLVNGVYGSNLSTTNDAAAIKGDANATTGRTFGVYGITNSSGTNSSGIRGQASSITGIVNGVYGSITSTSNDACGVKGEANGATGITKGVEGSTSSTTNSASGVFGRSTSGLGRTYGVYGTTPSGTDQTAGVYGISTNGSPLGRTYGVHGVSSATSTNSAGVKGESTAPVGRVYGVVGTTNSAGINASGVKGEAGLATAGANGVHGENLSTALNSCGVKGEALAITGVQTYGVSGYSASSDFMSAGVSARGTGAVGPGIPQSAALEIANGAIRVSGPSMPAGSWPVPGPWMNIYTCGAGGPPAHFHTFAYTTTVTIINDLITPSSFIYVTPRFMTPSAAVISCGIIDQLPGSCTVSVSYYDPALCPPAVGMPPPGFLNYLIITP